MDEGKEGPAIGTVDLSDKQKRVVAVAVTVLAVATIVAAMAGIVYVVARFFSYFANVFLPVAVAGIGALVCDPYFELLRNRLRLPKLVAFLVLFLSVILPVGAFGWFFGKMLVAQIADLIEVAPGWWEATRGQAEARWPAIQEFLNTSLGQRLRATVVENSENILEAAQTLLSKSFAAGAGLMHRLGALAGWAVTPVYFAFFLLAPSVDPKKLEAALPFLKKERREDVVFLLQEFVNHGRMKLASDSYAPCYRVTR